MKIGPLDLPGVAPVRGAELGDHDVAGRDPAARRVLRREAAVGIVHGHRAEEHDPGDAAFGAVRALRDRDELDVAHARPRLVGEREDRPIGQRGSLAQPLDLLLRLDCPQALEGRRHVDQLEARQGLSEALVVRVRHPHRELRVHAHEPDAPLLEPDLDQARGHDRSGVVAAPLDDRDVGHLAGVRDVVGEAGVERCLLPLVPGHDEIRVMEIEVVREPEGVRHVAAAHARVAEEHECFDV